jgi:regulator of protease activity HflC (stomatin/prohibitin superfamily)
MRKKSKTSNTAHDAATTSAASTGANRRPSIATTELEPNETTRVGVYVFALVVFVLGFGVVAAATWALLSPVTIIIAVATGLLCAACVRIAPQWERVAVLRFGRFNRIAGPGLYVLIPFFEYTTIHVDQRIMTSSFSAEAALTADLVPVDVDAILFWMVWDSERASLEVKNYPKAVLWSAQTALRDALGQTNLADLSMRRKQLDHELEVTLGKKCQDWGITVLSVEIRDIMIPFELQDALSKEAQAARERDARIILAEVERDISELYVEAADVYRNNPMAMQLRAMNLAYQGAKDSNGMFVVPSQLADSFDLKKILGGE